ncbi:MAG TPA: hypothetical protein VH817_03950 [Thermoleophilaceae bacterium]|jgi:hypothetical protein
MSRLRVADWASGFFGAALIGLLWAPWFHYWIGPGTLYSTSGGRGAASSDFFVRQSPNAWQSLAVGDVILLVAGLLGLWLLLATVLYETSAVPLTAAVAATFAGVAALVVALLAVLSPPKFTVESPHIAIGSALAPGPALALLAAVGLTISALICLRDERRAIPATVPLTKLQEKRA